jgi:hypothetical protein
VEGQLPDQALPLDDLLAGDILFDDAVGPGVIVVIEGVGVAEEGVGIEALDRGRIKGEREAEFLADDRLALVAHGDTAFVAGLGDDLDGEGIPPGDVPSEERGIDGRAQVVEVGDPDVTAPLGPEARQKSAAPERIRNIAVAGGVELRLALGVPEERAVGAEPQRDVLLEDHEARILKTSAEGLADRPVGGLAGHQPQRERTPMAAGEGLLLRQPELEEGLPGERLHQRLDDAAHASRHPTGQHQQRDLAPVEGLQPQLRVAPVLLRARRRRLDDVLRRRRTDRGEAVGGIPVDPLALLLDPAKEPRQVKGASRQAPLDLLRQRLDLVL